MCVTESARARRCVEARASSGPKHHPNPNARPNPHPNPSPQRTIVKTNDSFFPQSSGPKSPNPMVVKVMNQNQHATKKLQRPSVAGATVASQ